MGDVLDVKAIRARCDVLWSGPWSEELIAHARTDLPACLYVIERMAKALEAVAQNAVDPRERMIGVNYLVLLGGGTVDKVRAALALVKR